MDYSEFDLSPLEFAVKHEGRSLYQSGSYYQPDFFAGQVLDTITMEYGSVSAFCSANGFSRSQLLRGFDTPGRKRITCSSFTCNLQNTGP